MKRLQDPRWFLTLMFLAIIGGVPLIQTFREVREQGTVKALELFSQPPTAANLRTFERALEGANWLTHQARPWIQFAQFTWLGDGGAKAAIGLDGWYFYKPGLNALLERDGSREGGGRTNDPFAAIVDFRDQLEARGIKLMLMPVPNKESVYPDRVTARARGMKSVLAPRTRDLIARLRKAGVEVVDLFDHFKTRRSQPGSDSGEALYLAQDTHWSPRGVAEASQVAAHRLLELGWVSLGRTPYVEKPAPVKRVGDLLRMLQVPLIESRTPPEAVSCKQIVREDTGELYKDAADAQVLVLGDSFMRIYQQDQPTSAGFIAHLAKQLRHPLMAIVNDGGGSTLVRQELASNPVLLRNKKVVLWEFVERDITLGLHGWQRVPLALAPPSTSIPAQAANAGGAAPAAR